MINETFTGIPGKVTSTPSTVNIISVLIKQYQKQIEKELNKSAILHKLLEADLPIDIHNPIISEEL